MADPKVNMGTGSRQLDEQEARRLREREEAGLEPEQHPGPRQNEGISSAGRLYATQEEADEESVLEPGAERTDVDRRAAGLPDKEPTRE